MAKPTKFDTGMVPMGARAGPVAVILVLILVLVLRPSGLLGERVGDRA